MDYTQAMNQMLRMYRYCIYDREYCVSPIEKYTVVFLQDKEAKIMFLQKAIDTLGEYLDIKVL